MHKSIKFLALALVCGAFHQAFAAGATLDNCLAKIADAQRWPAISEQQLSCMNTNGEFKEAAKFLCLEDRSDVSKKYGRYREYQVRYESKLAEYNSTVDPAKRWMIEDELEEIGREWAVRGYRADVDGQLNLVEGVRFSCGSSTSTVLQSNLPL